MSLVGVTIRRRNHIVQKNTCKAYPAALSIVHEIFLYNISSERHYEQTPYPHGYQQSVSQGVGT